MDDKAIPKSQKNEFGRIFKYDDCTQFVSLCELYQMF